jgi:predicted DNA-binding transcriptional regulator YafY
MQNSRNESHERIIRDAITGRQVLFLRYHDVERTIEPHILGYDRHGHLALSAWQVAGTGAGWRLFHVDEITGLSETNSRFLKPAPGYNRRDPSFERVLRQV